MTAREKSIKTDYLFKEKVPYVDIDTDNGTIYFRKRIKFNSFLEQMGVKSGDILMGINETPITISNFREPIVATRQWKPGMDVTFFIKRDEKEIVLKGKTNTPSVSEWEIVKSEATENGKVAQLRKSWLKG